MEARWAHNPKVVGSNPTPATIEARKGFFVARKQQGNKKIIQGLPLVPIGVGDQSVRVVSQPGEQSALCCSEIVTLPHFTRAPRSHTWICASGNSASSYVSAVAGEPFRVIR